MYAWANKGAYAHGIALYLVEQCVCGFFKIERAFGYSPPCFLTTEA